MEERICGVEGRLDQHITYYYSKGAIRSIYIFFSLFNLIPNQKSTFEIEKRKIGCFILKQLKLELLLARY